MKKILLKVFSFTLLISLLASTMFSTSLSDYYTELDKIKKQQKEAADKLTGVEKEIQENLYDIIVLDEKVTKYTLELAE